MQTVSYIPSETSRSTYVVFILGKKVGFVAHGDVSAQLTWLRGDSILFGSMAGLESYLEDIGQAILSRCAKKAEEADRPIKEKLERNVA